MKLIVALVWLLYLMLSCIHLNDAKTIEIVEAETSDDKIVSKKEMILFKFE